MRQLPYDDEQAHRLLPLLNSIGREMIERQRSICSLLEPAGDGDGAALRSVQFARLADERRELRRVHEELEWLGCSLVGGRPLTFHVPGRATRGPRSFLWQGGALIAL